MTGYGAAHVIRPAVQEDVAAIEALVESAYRPWVERIGLEPGPLHHDYAERVEQADAFVVEDGGKLVGLLVLLAEGDHLLLENVAVDPGRQGEGIGSRLLDLAEERAAAAGLPSILLFTHGLMAANIAIYERRGYLREQRDDPYGRVFLRKRL